MNKSLLKSQGFWLTFISYSIIHALRMCYSFNKVNFQRDFQITEFHLGILDTLLYLSYGVGVLMRYQIFQGNQQMKNVFFITSVMISSCFGVLGYAGLFGREGMISVFVGKVLITIAVIGYGFFHLAAYQICGAIVSGYFHPQKQSHKLGFWGSSSSAGNIIGFLVSNIMIYQLQLKWQTSILLFAILNLIMTFVFYLWLQTPQQTDQEITTVSVVSSNNNNNNNNNNQHQQLLEQQNKQIRTVHWLSYIKRTISTSSQAQYTYLAYFTMKATVYTFLMWFPIFLVSKNLQSVSGYISTLFDIGGLIGGYIVGKIHNVNYYSQQENRIGEREFQQQQENLRQDWQEDQSRQNNNRSNKIVDVLLKYRNVIIIICIIVIIVGFIFVQGSLSWYCPLTFLIGFFLCGAFNNISSHQIFKIANGKPLLTDMLLNLSVGISTIMVGLVQLLIAIMLKWNVKNEDKNGSGNYSVFFVVLLGLMTMCIIVMVKRVFVAESYQQQRRNEKFYSLPQRANP